MGKIKDKEIIKDGNNEEIQRIGVSREAQAALGNIVDRVNDGFTGGKVHRIQMANWILLRFNSEIDEAQIREIRSEHFDEMAMLESVLKQAKETGKVPADLKALLQRHMGLDDLSKKKGPTKALTKTIINDDVKE